MIEFIKGGDSALVGWLIVLIFIVGLVVGLASLLWPGRGVKKVAETTETTQTTETTKTETTSAAGAEQKQPEQAASNAVKVWREAYIESVKGQPGVIPELITGDSLDSIQASVTASKAAFERVAGVVKASIPTTAPAVAAPTTPAPNAGGGQRQEQGPKLPENATGFDYIKLAVEQGATGAGKPVR
jgi:hypothetical protein